MKKTKRILAIIGIIILVALYAVTLVLAFSKNPDVQKWFIICIVATIIVPIIIYVYQWLYKLVKKDAAEAASKNYIQEEEEK